MSRHTHLLWGTCTVSKHSYFQIKEFFKCTWLVSFDNHVDISFLSFCLPIVLLLFSGHRHHHLTKPIQHFFLVIDKKHTMQWWSFLRYNSSFKLYMYNMKNTMMEWHGMTHPAPDLPAIIIVIITTQQQQTLKKNCVAFSFLFLVTTLSVFFFLEKAISFVSYQSYWWTGTK